MTISPRSGEELATVLSAIPGVTRLYSAHPTLLAVAATAIEATGRPGKGPVLVTGSSIRVRIGIDHTRSTAQVGAAVYDAIDEYLRSAASQSSPTIAIEIEIATIR